MKVKKYLIKTDMPPLPEDYPISATIVLDSISPDGVRITTLELVFPRIVLAEFNTHRVFSRNASSSRAIPTKKLVARALEELVEPVRYGKNQAGMAAAKENLEGEDLAEARRIWQKTAKLVANSCLRLAELGLHKQWASRPLEWFSTIKVVVTTTEFDNFFNLRDHSAAQDEICYLAQAWKTAMNNSIPTPLGDGEWHLPYVSKEELQELGVINALKVSTARCARVSYKTHHGITSSLDEDLELFAKLSQGGFQDEDNPFHASPAEHQARPYPAVEKYFSIDSDPYAGNFYGWRQHRKYIEINGFNNLN